MSEPDPLVQRAIGGDGDALEQLLRGAVDDLRGAIRIDPRWRRSIEFEDILQVTSLEAFLRIGALAEPTRAAFSAWLRRIAQNNLLDAVRSLDRKKRPDARDRVTHGPDGQSARTLLAVIAGEQATAGSQAALREELERMRRALGEMPGSYRDVLERIDLGGASVREVAEQGGRTVGSVHMLRARALERLRELMT